ncbi:MAG: M1 family metallopeptidase [Ignavibacteria bacterium]|nr:M1 family metallopeptidase [Ignavibacteria bacterium]
MREMKKKGEIRGGISILLLLLAAGTPLLSQQDETHIYQPGVDVLHYNFTLDLPDRGNFVQGKAELTVRRYRPIQRLRLDLVGLNVGDLQINGKPASFEQDAAGISLTWPRSMHAREDTIVVSIEYGGPVQRGLIIDTDASGRWTAFGDNWPDQGRQWLPTVDHPSDKATVEWNIRASSDLTVVANGEFVERTPLRETRGVGNKPRVLTRWRIQRPIPVYLMVIAAAPLVKFDLGLTAPGLSEFPPGVRQSVYVEQEIQDYLPGPFKHAGAIVTFFAQTVGLFPYEKLAHVQSRTTYGGMENASAIFYNHSIFSQRSVSIGLIAHETAHQWFGDAVTPRDWSQIWLSEGFATYFEKLWVERSEGTSAFKRQMIGLRDEILQAREVHERPVIDSLQTNLMALLNTNSYQKAGWTLHMLRSLLGDSLFFFGIKSYYERFRHATATTDDFCLAMEQVSGRSLRWFFDQWHRRPGYAIVSARWRYDKATRRVVLEISQGKRFEPYRFPLTVEIVHGGGLTQQTTLEIAPQPRVTVTLPIPAGSEPTGIYLDPDVQLLASVKTSRLD